MRKKVQIELEAIIDQMGKENKDLLYNIDMSARLFALTRDELIAVKKENKELVADRDMWKEECSELRMRERNRVEGLPI